MPNERSGASLLKAEKGMYLSGIDTSPFISVFQQVYNLVDSMVVGKYVGDQTLAAVGVCGGAFSLIISLISGLTGGTSVVMAQYFGAGNSGSGGPHRWGGWLLC